MLDMCAYESIYVVSINHESRALLSMCSYQLAMPSNSLVVLVTVQVKKSLGGGIWGVGEGGGEVDTSKGLRFLTSR